MLDAIKQINVGKGLGPLTFGSTQEQVLALLGEPAEREKYSLSELENDDTEAWHYDDLDLSRSFDEENEWRLSSIAISGEEYLLDGQSLIGKSKAEMIAFILEHGWDEPQEDEEVKQENSGNCLLHVDKASISLWFENDLLTEMQIGQSYSEEQLN